LWPADQRVNSIGMADVTRLLDAAAAGDRQAAADLLPLVYDELRKLASARMSAEAPGHTLNATALVHEAYLRLVGDQQFDGRGHFFAAAAEAMRRILVESARRRATAKRGGDLVRVPFPENLAACGQDSDILGVHEVVDQLAAYDSKSAELVKLHVFGGLPLEQAAEVLGVSPRVVYRDWAFARAWMFRRMGGSEKNS
jgi:RNA polymerase sigma factor (TIGR02999 family)